MGERQITEEDVECHVTLLQDLQNDLDQAEDDLLRGIIRGHDELGMSYAQLGEALEVAKSWAFKLYKKGKKRGLK